MPEYPECAHDLCEVDLGRRGTCVQLCTHRNCGMISPVHQVEVMWGLAPRCSFQGPETEYCKTWRSNTLNQMPIILTWVINLSSTPGTSPHLLFSKSFAVEWICPTVHVTYHFSKVALTYNIIQWESNTGLVVPNFPHDVVEKGHDADTSIWISMLQFCKHCWSEVISEK